ncbi:MAG: dTDP-glucose 4,6-dehydratase [Pseudoflavonifractor sp.]|nr:dTDP-glucose 4,6-dehydratase [Alloprevotella sp.]MCM1116718.1 dTDP-glucose 4,6-dehydratase [Pseudoflavonifractor sp.]
MNKTTDRRFKAILVTGGAGFIGSHLVHLLTDHYPDTLIINVDLLTYAGNLANVADLDERNNYRFVKADICNSAAMLSLITDYEVDAVINLAAESHVDRSISNPDAFAKTNVMGTLSMLNAAKTSWAARPEGMEGKIFYQVSTDEVFGSLMLGDKPFDEATPYAPHSPYSASKAAADHFVRAYHDTYGLPTVISNCSNNFGPNQFPEKLIPLVINNIKERRPIPVYGRGENIRDWLWVGDHVRAIDLILHHAEPGSTFCIGGNNEMRNIDLVKALIEITDRFLGRPEGDSLGLISFVTDRPGHDLRYAIDASRLRDSLGWLPTPRPLGALADTVEWYLDNEKWLNDITSGAYADYYREMYGGSR